jgi:hypothetical protein
MSRTKIQAYPSHHIIHPTPTRALFPIPILVWANRTERALRPRTRHLSISSSFSCCIICLQNPRLTLVCLREGISALLAHSLHLTYFADGFLELFHPNTTVSGSRGIREGKGCEKGFGECHIPRSVILDVIFLNFLNMVVGLGVVHSFGACKR